MEKNKLELELEQMAKERDAFPILESSVRWLDCIPIKLADKKIMANVKDQDKRFIDNAVLSRTFYGKRTFQSILLVLPFTNFFTAKRAGYPIITAAMNSPTPTVKTVVQ
jgi:hypothetical protein